MSRWWRAYDEALDDPKLQRLGGEIFKFWFNMMCLASKNGGRLPSMADIAFAVRLNEARAQKLVEELQRCGLLDETPDGTLQPHNWSERQYESDVSTGRVQRFRKRKRNVSSSVSETAPEQNRTEAEKDDDVDAAREPLISRQANELADHITRIVGYEPEHPPPQWYGAAMETSKWLREGWKPEIILLCVQKVMGKMRGQAPPLSIRFFEREIAAEHARQAAPLPKATIVEPQQIKVLANGTDRDAVKARYRAAVNKLGNYIEGAAADGDSGEAAIRLLPGAGRG